MLIKIQLIIITFLLLTISTTFAEQVTFVKEYTYQASELDSKESSRTIALEQVKRLLVEELGTFLASKTEVKNFELTKDQITSITSGMVKTEILDEKWDGKTYYLKAKVTADPKEMAESVDKVRNDKEKKEEFEETKEKTDAALNEVNKLRKELQAIKADKNQQEAYRKAVNSLSANEWIDKGHSFLVSGDYEKAIDAFDRALEINPGLPQAYLQRGAAYLRSGRKIRAIHDFDNALKINPKMPRAYLFRGIAYQKLGRNRKAIDDFDNAIEINPKMARAYFRRGLAYKALGNRQKSIEDIKTAEQLNFDKAHVYLKSEGLD